MITVKRLASSCDRMIEHNFSFIGPIDYFGGQEEESFDLRSPHDFLKQGKSMYGENDVGNRQVNALISASPLLQNVRPKGAYGVEIDLKTSTGVKLVRSQPYGLFQDGDCKIVEKNAYRTTQQFVYRAGNVWHIYTVVSYVNKPTYLSNWDHIVISNIRRVSNDKFDYRVELVKYSSGSPGMPTNINWTQPQSAAAIINVETLLPISKRTTSRTTETSNWYRLFNSDTDSIATLYGHVDDAVREILSEAINFDEPHFGQLAAEAAAVYNGNDVNVLEFIRDLRHPERLLPKIKNFQNLSLKRKSLKGLSNEYLSAHYGVMPTISDVSELWSSFTKHRAYYDKHGYESVSAGGQQQKNVNGITAINVRRLKLAIAKETSSFDAAVSALDKAGVLPSVDNIWELIPYTFVIDWFLHVGDVLEAQSARNRLARYNIRYVTMSQKDTFTKSIGDSATSYVGVATVVNYHRWTTDRCPLPPLLPQFDTNGSSHWLEATALILQRC